MLELDDLSTLAFEELQQALLPGEEVRFITRPRIRLFSEQNLIMTLGVGFSLIWWIVFAVMLGVYLSEWLEEERSAASFCVVYGVLMLCYYIGRIVSIGTLEEYQARRRSIYLLTTHRAMILVPGAMVKSFPLRSCMIQRSKQWPDGTGHIYLQPQGEEEPSPLTSACFACVPEPYRVVNLIRELAAHVPALSGAPVMQSKRSKRLNLDPVLYRKLASRLEVGEHILWIGKSMAKLLTFNRQERCKGLCELLIAATACGCSWAALFMGEGNALGMVILSLVHLLVFFLMIFTQYVPYKEVYAITDRRVCCLTHNEASDFERRIEGIWHYPCGAVMIIIKFSSRPPQVIGPTSGIKPVLLLWSESKE